MIHSKHIVVVLIIVVAVCKFSSGTSLASSSYRQYLQYKNSETYKMIHGEENEDTDSEQKGDTDDSPDDGHTTDDYISEDTDSYQPEDETDEMESYIEGQGWEY
jgi:hypothetical protein